jgi:hypothetical protein
MRRGKAIVDDDGQMVMGAKYSGLHALRHFFLLTVCGMPGADGSLDPRHDG